MNITDEQEEEDSATELYDEDQPEEGRAKEERQKQED
jgi:hypothetical protein